jgi:hypothetical protein
MVGSLIPTYPPSSENTPAFGPQDGRLVRSWSSAAPGRSSAFLLCRRAGGSSARRARVEPDHSIWAGMARALHPGRPRSGPCAAAPRTCTPESAGPCGGPGQHAVRPAATRQMAGRVRVTPSRPGPDPRCLRWHGTGHACARLRVKRSTPSRNHASKHFRHWQSLPWRALVTWPDTVQTALFGHVRLDPETLRHHTV